MVDCGIKQKGKKKKTKETHGAHIIWKICSKIMFEKKCEFKFIGQ